MNYAPRITYPYEKLAPWISRVALVSERTIWYEHSDDQNNIHCHAIIMGLSKTIKTIKDWLKEMLQETPTGNQWMFPQTYKDKETGESRPVDDEFVKYMTKGKYDPKYNKGYSPEFVAEQKAKGFDGKAKKGAQRVSKSIQCYNEFVDWLNDKDNHKTKPVDLQNEESIRSAAYRFIMGTGVVPMNHEFQLMRGLVIKYCWDYQLPLPRTTAKKLEI